MDGGFWFRQEGISFKGSPASRTVSLGTDLINRGFLTQFPGSSLAAFLLLASKGAELEAKKLSLQELNCLIPGSLDEVITGLEYLQEREIIVFEKSNPQQKRFDLRSLKKEEKIYISLNPSGLMPSQKNEEPAPTTINDNDLVKKLIEFFPGQSGSQARKQAETEIKRWCDDFPPGLIEELLNRVHKWLEHPQNPHERAHYYLRAIISDWYEKEIFSFEKLQEYDRLYRETRELARIYGFKNYHQLNPIQLETLQSWLKGGQGLSVQLACWAVKKAVKQKRDGRPSLDYIERNYIQPLKDAGVQNTEAAEAFFNKRSKEYHQKDSSNDTANNTIDIDDETDEEEFTCDLSWDSLEWEEPE